MQITFLTQLDWLIRLILAGVCGYAPLVMKEIAVPKMLAHVLI